MWVMALVLWNVLHFVATTLFVEGNERVDHVGDALRRDESQQRVLRAEGVPQREGGVVLERARVVLLVAATVGAVHVVEQDGRDARLVNVRVEGAQDFRIV